MYWHSAKCIERKKKNGRTRICVHLKFSFRNNSKIYVKLFNQNVDTISLNVVTFWIHFLQNFRRKFDNIFQIYSHFERKVYSPAIMKIIRCLVFLFRWQIWSQKTMNCSVAGWVASKCVWRGRFALHLPRSTESSIWNDWNLKLWNIWANGGRIRSLAGAELGLYESIIIPGNF